MKKIFDLYKNSPEYVRFVVNALVLGLIWIVFYKLLRYKPFVNEFYEAAIVKFTYFLTESNRLFLELLGYDAVTYGKTIKIIGSAGVYLDKGCLARNLMGLYAGFVLAYPGSIKNKLWYIPLGLVIINILNIFRLSALAIISKCCPEHVEFNHHYIFKIVVFAFTLLLWYFWIFKLSNPAKKAEKKLH